VHLDVDNDMLIARAAVRDGWLAAIDLSSFRRSVHCAAPDFLLYPSFCLSSFSVSQPSMKSR
jgi:hypothetical protein